MRVERLAPGDYSHIRRLLVELHLAEQPHYPDHPQVPRDQIERDLARVPPGFEGENVIFAVRRDEEIAGFCWCVLFDPGTGLEGEVAELYVAEAHRGGGIGNALVAAAVELFRDRAVTLGYVWTRPDNRAAVRMYEGGGFRETTQLILTWYPDAGGGTKAGQT